MFYQPQKVIFSPQKVKKVKKVKKFIFYFSHIVREKVTLIHIFLNFGPLPIYKLDILKKMGVVKFFKIRIILTKSK